MSDADLPAGRPPAVWPGEGLEELFMSLAVINPHFAGVIRDAIAAHQDLVARYTEEKALWRGTLGRILSLDSYHKDEEGAMEFERDGISGLTFPGDWIRAEDIEAILQSPPSALSDPPEGPET